MEKVMTILGAATLSLVMGTYAWAMVDIQTDDANVSVSGGDVNIDTGNTHVDTHMGNAHVKTGARSKKKGAKVKTGKSGLSGVSVQAQSGASSLKISGDGKIEIQTPNGSVVINGQIGRVTKKQHKKVSINEIEPVAYNFDGNDDHVLKNKYIETADIAVTIGENSSVTIVNCLIKANTALKLSGNCEVKIISCTIIGDAVAIIADDNSSVNITDSTVTGGEQALVASGNSTITVSDSSVTGELVKNDNGDIEDEGNTEFID